MVSKFLDIRKKWYPRIPCRLSVPDSSLHFPWFCPIVAHAARGFRSQWSWCNWYAYVTPMYINRNRIGVGFMWIYWRSMGNPRGQFWLKVTQFKQQYYSDSIPQKRLWKVAICPSTVFFLVWKWGGLHHSGHLRLVKEWSTWTLHMQTFIWGRFDSFTFSLIW